MVIGLVPSAATLAQTALASDAEGTVLGIDLGGTSLLGLGSTTAHAEESAEDTSATAAVVELLGDVPLVQLGGEQVGVGESSGALLDTAGTSLDDLGQIALTPWRATVTEDAQGRHARSRAAAADVVLAPNGSPLLDLSLLRSTSEANHNGATSDARAVTDGVALVLGDPNGTGLSITVLHSEASSNGGSLTYLVDINGTRIGSSTDDLGAAIAQICGALTLPGVLELVCVRATGGFAEFVDGVVAGGLAHVDVAQARASTGVSGGAGGPAGAPTTAGGAPGASAPSVLGARVEGETPRALDDASLPRTGMATQGIASLAMAALAAAAILRRWTAGLVR
jgi:hypothetical protein